jgi:hypothetical protein
MVNNSNVICFTDVLKACESRGELQKALEHWDALCITVGHKAPSICSTGVRFAGASAPHGGGSKGGAIPHGFGKKSKGDGLPTKGWQYLILDYVDRNLRGGFFLNDAPFGNVAFGEEVATKALWNKSVSGLWCRGALKKRGFKRVYISRRGYYYFHKDASPNLEAMSREFAVPKSHHKKLLAAPPKLPASQLKIKRRTTGVPKGETLEQNVEKAMQLIFDSSDPVVTYDRVRDVLGTMGIHTDSTIVCVTIARMKTSVPNSILFRNYERRKAIGERNGRRNACIVYVPKPSTGKFFKNNL